MLGAGVQRREQGEQKIDRAIVQRLIGDGRLQPDEDGADAVQALDAGVRHGDARAETRRAERLSLQEGVQRPILVNAQGHGRGLGHGVQRLTLG